MQQAPLLVLPKHTSKPQSNPPSSQFVSDAIQPNVDLISIKCIWMRGPARLTWSILRAASSPVHKNMGYWAQSPGSCKMFILPGCEKVKSAIHLQQQLHGCSCGAWWVAKAAPALTSQWQTLTGLPTPPHFFQLTHHMDPQTVIWSSWAAGAKMDQYDHGWWRVAWETTKPAWQPHEQKPMDTWPSPKPWRNTAVPGCDLAWQHAPSAKQQLYVSELYMKEHLQPGCSSSAQGSCTQVYQCCHITLYPWQNHPAAKNGGQNLLQASASPHLQHTDHI